VRRGRPVVFGPLTQFSGGGAAISASRAAAFCVNYKPLRSAVHIEGEETVDPILCSGFGRESADRLTEAGAARLSRALVAKSIAEALFVAALFAAFSYTHFHPKFRGAVDVADARTVEGWVVDEAGPGRQVEVQLFIDGRFVAQASADRPRPDVLAAGRAARAEHGFRFDTPPLAAREAEYEARVYALHAAGDGERRTLNQIGKALRFRVGP
jgi:hypothetical protein